MNDMSKEVLARQELAKRKAKKHFWFFVHNFCMMWLKEGGDPIHFKLWPFQKDAAEKFQHQQKLIVLKARQMGMSWLAMAYVVWCVLYKSNFHVYVTSIGLKEVQEQMERIRFIWMNLPEWIRGDVVLGGKGCKDNDSLIEFTNGSAVHAIASSKSGGHGAAPGLYILDEFARKENDVMAWRAIKPSLGRKSQVIIISTSNGFNNLYAELWFGACGKSNEFTPIFYSAHEHPEYTPEYIEEQRRDFAGDLVGFKEAFPETPEDAFLSSSRSVFDIERIREHKQYIKENDIRPRIGRIEEDTDGSVGFIDDDAGNIHLWKEPNPNHFYVAGTDIAEGLVQGDWSVTVIVDTDLNEVAAMYRGKIAPENYSYPVLNLVKFYNNAWTVIEVNKNAEALVNDLKLQYPWLYTRMKRENITDKGTPVVGFVSSSTSKPRIIMQLRREFSDFDKPLRIYSDIILDEMAAFEENDRKGLEAAQGYFDDCVMALAMAIEGKTTMPTQRASTHIRAREPQSSGSQVTFGVQRRSRNWRSL